MGFLEPILRIISSNPIFYQIYYFIAFRKIPLWPILSTLWIVLLIMWSIHQIHYNIIHTLILSWMMTLADIAFFAFFSSFDPKVQFYHISFIDVITYFISSAVFVFLFTKFRLNFSKTSTSKRFIYYPMIILGSFVQFRKLVIYALTLNVRRGFNLQFNAMASMLAVQLPSVIDLLDLYIFSNRSKITFYSAKHLIISSLLILICYSTSIPCNISKIFTYNDSFFAGFHLFTCLIIYYIVIY